MKIRLGPGLPIAEQGTYLVTGESSATKINGFVGNPGIGGGLGGHLQWAVLNQPGARLEILLDKSSLGIGESGEATLRVTALDDGPMTISFKPPVLAVNDTALLNVEAVPLPAPFVIHAQDRIRTFTVSLDTKKSGIALLTSAITVENPDASVRMVTAEQELDITVKGDLLIKRDDESETAFAINDSYQKAPLLQQRRTEFIRPTDTLRYQVKIENDAKLAITFFLHLAETSSEGWASSYTYNGVDISETAQSAQGWQTPGLEPGASILVQIELAPPNQPEEQEATILAYLTAESDDLMTLDSVAIVATTRDVIVVNVTGREKDADADDGVIDVDLKKEGNQITLRAAIDFANAREGKDRIEFDIPGSGIPSLDVAAPNPTVVTSQRIFGYELGSELIAEFEISDPVEIDGRTQSAGWVELDGFVNNFGSQFVIGISISSGDCRISGLVINRFSGWGLFLTGGGGNWIVGNRIGTNTDGEVALGNGTTKLAPRKTVDFAGLGGGLVVNSAGNLIENNIIAGNWKISHVDHVLDEDFDRPMLGADLWLAGPEASENTVIGNHLGYSASGKVLRQNIKGRGLQISDDARNNRIGDGTTQGRNLIHTFSLVDSSGSVFIGNQIGFGLDAHTESYFLGAGFISRSQDTLIGGTQPGQGNIIAGYTQIADSTGIEIYGNILGFHVDENIRVDLPGRRLGILNSLVTLGGPGAGEGNEIALGSIATVFTDLFDASSDRGLTYSGNSIFTSEVQLLRESDRWNRALLDNGLDGKDINDFNDSDRKPNYPLITSAVLADGQITLLGGLSSSPGIANYRIEFFEVTIPHDSGHGGVMTPLGRTVVINDIGGFRNFEVTIPAPGLAFSSFVCATSTKVDGSTSEFSANRLIDGNLSTDSDGISDAHEQVFGDRNLDGNNDSLQDRVASFMASSGEPTTLELPAPSTANFIEDSEQDVMRSQVPANGETVLENVVPESQASSGAPIGYFYPNGVIEFDIAGLAPGGSTSLRLILADSASVDTVWVLGANQSWIRIIPIATTNNELSFIMVDGGIGDRDGEANGRIVAAVGAAETLPPVPPMELTLARADSHTVLSWSAFFGDVTPEISCDLSPDSWITFDENLELHGDRIAIPLIVPRNPSTPQHYFFRLRR